MMAEKPTHEKINQKKILPKTSSAQWQTTFDAINDAVCLLGMNGKILRCNKAMESLLKKSSGEIINGTCWELVHGTDKPIKGCPIVRMKKTRCRETLALKVDDKCLNVTVDPVIDETGNLASAVHIISDITRRKQAEEKLQAGQLKYRQLFETMPSGVAIYEAVNDGDDFIFRDFNQAGENIEKVKKEDVIGRRVTEAFPGVRQFGLFKVFQRVWRTGKPEYFPETIYRDERDPGTWRESWVYKLPDGKIVSVYNDITERKRAENSLRESEQRLKEAHKIARIGMWNLDIINNRLQWSDSIFELFEVDPRKFKASYEAFLDAIHPADREKINLAYTESIKTKLPYEISHRLLMKDGRIKWVHEICRTEYDSQGQALRSVGIVQDITERKLAEEELQKRMNELEIFYRATLGREGRVIELKQEVNELLEQLGKNKKYGDYSK